MTRGVQTQLLAQTFAVPPLLLGSTPEPRSTMEREDRLLVMADAAGREPWSLGPEIQNAALRRYIALLGLDRKGV